MDRDSELKPCPFCGGQASDKGHVHYTHRKKENQNAWWGDGTPIEDAYFCSCIVCGARNGGIAGGYQTVEIAREKWNRRTTQTPV